MIFEIYKLLTRFIRFKLDHCKHFVIVDICHHYIHSHLPSLSLYKFY